MGSLKFLRRINLSDNNWLRDDVIASISKNCLDLEEIVVKNCNYLTHVGVTSALQESKNLKTIRLSGCYGNMDMINHHRNLDWPRGLTEIEFSKMEVSNGLLRSMVRVDLPLKRVTLESCKSFNYNGLKLFFDRYDDLDYLALVGVDFLEYSSIITLSKCFKKTRHVKLNECGEFSISALLALLKNCPLLETVEMEAVEIDDPDEDDEELDVVNHRIITVEIEETDEDDEELDAVNHRIRNLNLSNNYKNLDDKSLKKIAATCPNLESLKLDYCGAISSKGVGEIMRSCCYLKDLQIRSCPRVTKLNFDACGSGLESLDARGSGLDDGALVEIVNKCSDLTFLNLSRCGGLTSKGVTEVVSKCTKLKEINLGGCWRTSERLLCWMIVRRPTLRRVVPPEHCGNLDPILFWRQYGCYVEPYSRIRR